MAEIARKTKRYPTDLTDEEWKRIQPLLLKPPKRGRKVSVDLREMLNAIRYMARSGGGWRMLPTNFGPWQTVSRCFRRFVRRMLFQTIHDVSDARSRARWAGSQPVRRRKSTYEATTPTRDTRGRVLMVNFTTVDISDSAGAQAILDAVRKRWPCLKHLFADGAYDHHAARQGGVQGLCAGDRAPDGQGAGCQRCCPGAG